jgi:catechol 2,3-dioxygenase-like lactoylglutathione lyase family enzyme
MVDDVNAAVAFYTTHFGFTRLRQAGQALDIAKDADQRF